MVTMASPHLFLRLRISSILASKSRDQRSGAMGAGPNACACHMHVISHARIITYVTCMS